MTTKTTCHKPFFLQLSYTPIWLSLIAGTCLCAGVIWVSSDAKQTPISQATANVQQALKEETEALAAQSLALQSEHGDGEALAVFPPELGASTFGMLASEALAPPLCETLTFTAESIALTEAQCNLLSTFAVPLKLNPERSALLQVSENPSDLSDPLAEAVGLIKDYLIYEEGVASTQIECVEIPSDLLQTSLDESESIVVQLTYAPHAATTLLEESVEQPGQRIERDQDQALVDADGQRSPETTSPTDSDELDLKRSIEHEVDGSELTSSSDLDEEAEADDYQDSQVERLDHDELGAVLVAADASVVEGIGEPSPAAADITPVVSVEASDESTTVVQANEIDESTPAVEAKAVAESEPAATDVAPVVAAEASDESEPVVEAKAVTEPEPAATDVAPVLAVEASAESAPVVEAKAVTEPEPVATDIAPVVAVEASAESAPVVEAKAVTEPEPAATDVAPVVAVEVPKESAPVVEAKAVTESAMEKEVASKPATEALQATEKDEAALGKGQSVEATLKAEAERSDSKIIKQSLSTVKEEEAEEDDEDDDEDETFSPYFTI